MIEDIYYIGNIIFVILIWRLILEIILSIIRLGMKKNGTSTDDEYHRLYEESIKWMMGEGQKKRR